jgi:DNA invertase Pin-like site-specific DNA recombinase
VSTAEQHPENQLAELRQFCERAGLDVVAEYTDADSGARADRAQFQRMLADIERQLIRERTRAGLARARAMGKRIGRPPAQADAQAIAEMAAHGKSARDSLRAGTFGIHRAAEARSAQ